MRSPAGDVMAMAPCWNAWLGYAASQPKAHGLTADGSGPECPRSAHPRVCDRLLGRRAFCLAVATPVAVGDVVAFWLAVASAHLVCCLLVVAVHEASYLARQR